MVEATRFQVLVDSSGDDGSLSIQRTHRLLKQRERIQLVLLFLPLAPRFSFESSETSASAMELCISYRLMTLTSECSLPGTLHVTASLCCVGKDVTMCSHNLTAFGDLLTMSDGFYEYVFTINHVEDTVKLGHQEDVSIAARAGVNI